MWTNHFREILLSILEMSRRIDEDRVVDTVYMVFSVTWILASALTRSQWWIGPNDYGVCASHLDTKLP